MSATVGESANSLGCLQGSQFAAVLVDGRGGSGDGDGDGFRRACSSEYLAGAVVLTLNLNSIGAVSAKGGIRKRDTGTTLSFDGFIGCGFGDDGVSALSEL